MKKAFIIFSFIFFLLLFNISYSHQPRLVKSEIIEIKNPEVSQAFYAELKGNPQIYTLKSDKKFKLYIGLLVPDILGIDTNISALITKKENHDKQHRYENSHKHEEFKILLDGSKHKWTHYYEKHGGDDYLTGPAFQADDSKPESHPKGVEVEAGEYSIKVFSKLNKGKYVFVIGYKEEFPIPEIINTVITVPQVKSYFEKSIFSAFSTPTMMGFLAVTMILIIAIIYIMFKLVMRLKKKIKK